MIRHKLVKPYMESARAFAQLSRAERRKVGAIAVTPQDLIIYSWNGTAEGDDNTCEVDGVTRPEVLHAEANVVSKSSREGVSLKGASIFVTASPCMECAKLLKQAGVVSVIYDEEYRLLDGIDYLQKRGVHCEQYKEEE